MYLTIFKRRFEVKCIHVREGFTGIGHKAIVIKGIISRHYVNNEEEN